LLCPVIIRVPTPSTMTTQNGTNDSWSSSHLSSAVPLETGTLLSLPGSVLHAGPSSTGFRAVLFFTAWPGGGSDTEPAAAEAAQDKDSVDSTTSTTTTTRLVPPYNPDTQYWKPLLISDLTSAVWDELSNDSDHVYLLTKLADSLKSSNCKDLHCHLSDPSMKHFTKCIEQGLYPRGKRTEFIAKFAAETKSRIQPIGFGFFDSNGEYLEKLSADNLVTMWNGKSYDMHVYRNNTASKDSQDCINPNRIPVCIYYPGDETWEGTIPARPYYLIMTRQVLNQTATNKACEQGRTKQTVLFDGTNGVLQDCDGEVIECATIRHSPEAPKRKAPSSVSSGAATISPNRDKRSSNQ
jgi:hypothetical protein